MRKISSNEMRNVNGGTKVVCNGCGKTFKDGWTYFLWFKVNWRSAWYLCSSHQQSSRRCRYSGAYEI